MDRLTFEGNFCDISMCPDTPGGSFCEDGYCSQRKVWERLKQYEDTGLSPEEILSAMDLAIIACALHELNAYKDLGQIDHLRTLLQAEQDGRLLVLPWAVGETIYEADPEHGVVKHTLVDAAWCMHSKAEDCKGIEWYDFWEAADKAYKSREEAALTSMERKEGAE